MNILFAVSEGVPFIKSGGLADVAGALPKELKRLGADVRIMMPKYGTIHEKFRKRMTKIAEFIVHVGWRQQYCAVETLVEDGITYYFIDNEYYFKRDSLYGHYDDGERFSYFCRAILEALPQISYQPDVIHCHDWHTGMVPFLLRAQYMNQPFYRHIRTVFTIHNLQFQGVFPRSILHDLLGLSDEYFTTNLLEFHGNVNFMKAALVAANHITTVSPTYKNEIQTSYFGENLDGLLREKNHQLTGIVNGIDYDVYNPEKDPFIHVPFSATDLAAKQENKLMLQRTFGLPEKDVPLMAVVSRLTSQKGFELVRHVFGEMLSNDMQLIVLGTGEHQFEHFFSHMSEIYPEKVRVYIGFNEALAHTIYAGADLFLMPSRFEPCGLGQLIAMRYGALPIVRETGGLNDTVQAFNEATGEGNGFSFTNINAHDMLYTIERALSLYDDKAVWNTIVREAMTRDYSWTQSARKYMQLYENITVRGGSHVL